MELKKIVLKVIHPFVVAGRIIAGGELIEMLEHEARQLLDGGKVELATSDDDAKPVIASTVPVPGAQQAPAVPAPQVAAVDTAAAQPSTLARTQAPAPAVDAAPAADIPQTQPQAVETAQV